jgi:hypothetical protein
MGVIFMSIWQLFFILAFIILTFMFLPDIFPNCACCGRKKPRPFFMIHKVVGLSPGYRGNRSVCTKCCRKYGIKSLKDLEQVRSIRRKLKLESLSRNFGD